MIIPGVKRPASGTNLLSRGEVMRAANFYSLFHVFVSSLVMNVVTPCRSEHSQDWHTSCWNQLGTVRFCVRLLLTGVLCVLMCGLRAPECWLECCFVVVCVLLICDLCATDIWLVCCWFVVCVPQIYGWCAIELWLACRWFVISLPMICAWCVADLCLVCGWFVVGVPLNCCFAQDLWLACLRVVDIVCKWFVFGFPMTWTASVV